MPNEEDLELMRNWFGERRTDQNWLNIEPEDEIPTFISGWNRTIVQMFQVAFSPEIRERLKDGRLSKDTIITSCQLMQYYGGGREIRLNDEVRGVAKVRATRNVESGSAVLRQDFDDLEHFDLLEEEMDAGHFTLIFTGKGWAGGFDFRMGRMMARSDIEKAIEFLESARFAQREGYSGPAIENLYMACELGARAQLTMGQIKIREAKTHNSIKSHLNRQAKLGNVEPAFISLFNRLGRDRNPARYDIEVTRPLPSEEDISLAEAYLTRLREGIRPIDNIGNSNR